MSRYDILVDRLQGVKQRGPSQVMARCPAHSDKTASLSVKHCDDGRVLLHCFAGCEPDAILGAVGLEFSHLFPDRVTDHAPPQRNRPGAMDMWRIVSHEMMVCAVVASDIEQSKSVSAQDWKRFSEAASILIAARRYIDAE